MDVIMNTVSPVITPAIAPCCSIPRHLVAAAMALGALTLSGCSSQSGYSKAFSEKTALTNNSHTFAAPADQAFRTVKITLVQQGFTIEQADIANGLIKAARTFEDPKQTKYSYLVTTSVDVTGTPSGTESVVTMSAGQQTILHKDSEKYFHLLGLVPIPTGKVYQTIVTKEGNVIDKSFYVDFFADVGRNIALYAAAEAKAAEAKAAEAAKVAEAKAAEAKLAEAMAAEARAAEAQAKIQEPVVATTPLGETPTSAVAVPIESATQGVATSTVATSAVTTPTVPAPAVATASDAAAATPLPIAPAQVPTEKL
jgi:hypothetical protein